MKFTEFCIRRPVFTTVLSLILIVMGLIGFYRIPVRGYPDINPPVVMVRTTYDGASASVLESQVTTPVENNLAGIPGLQSMHSYSEQGESRVVLKFKLGVNINVAVNDVRDRLARISQQIPTDADAPVIEKRDPNSMQTMVLALTYPGHSAMAITDYANRYIVTKLQQIEGVARVQLFNERDYAMRINVSPEKMAANQVTVGDLTSILQSQNVNVPSGQIKSQDRYYSVTSQNQLSTANAFRNLIIREQNGFMLRFKDVATINVGPADTDSAMRVNGKPAIGIGIYADSTANPLSVADNVKHVLATLGAELPPGMKLKAVWNNTTYLKNALHNVYHDIVYAVLLVVVVVTLFLGSIRSAIIPIVTIPICLIGVCALIYFLDFSINVFTLLAFVLAIGLVVDDAIVMLENIYRHIESGMKPFAAAIKGSGEIVFAIIAMTLTLAAVYAPIGFATGMAGVIFRQFAFTLALTVILSGLVALTLSPMMSARLLTAPSTQAGLARRYASGLQRFFHRLMQLYQCVLNWCLCHRAVVVGVLILFCGIGYWSFRHLPMELAPKEDQGVFMISIDSPPNASFAYTDGYAKQLEKIARALPGVNDVVMMDGADFGGFGFVILTPWQHRQYSAQQLISQFMQKAQTISGVRVGAFSPGQIGGGGNKGDSVEMVISSDASYPDIYHTAKRVIETLSKNPGLKNVTQSLKLGYKQYHITINRNLAAAMTVKMSDITNTLKTMLAGSTVTQFNWHARDYDVILQIPQKRLASLQVIDNLYVRNAHNQMVPLSSLAKVTPVVGPETLPHENRLRADTITAQMSDGNTLGQAVAAFSEAAKTNLPSNYQFRYKGAAHRFKESKHTMLGTFLLAVLFIYLVLAAQFESFIDPFVILLTVPFCIIGAVLTLQLVGGSLSIYANIGFVTLIGLIAKHGILITEFTNQLRAQGKACAEALVEAATLRLRPILMTTAAMAIGALPLALASGAGALSRQGIGWVIMGGLVLGTFFSLIVVPVAYSFFGQFKKMGNDL